MTRKRDSLHRVFSVLDEVGQRLRWIRLVLRDDVELDDLCAIQAECRARVRGGLRLWKRRAGILADEPRCMASLMNVVAEAHELAGWASHKRALIQSPCGQARHHEKGRD